MNTILGAIVLIIALFFLGPLLLSLLGMLLELTVSLFFMALELLFMCVGLFIELIAVFVSVLATVAQFVGWAFLTLCGAAADLLMLLVNAVCYLWRRMTRSVELAETSSAMTNRWSSFRQRLHDLFTVTRRERVGVGGAYRTAELEVRETSYRAGFQNIRGAIRNKLGFLTKRRKQN